MAPLPENNTETWFLRYTSMEQEHTLQFRVLEMTAESAVITFADALVAILRTAMLQTDSIMELQRRVQGSQFTFTRKTYNVQGNVVGVGGAGQQTQFYSWTGRSDEGRDVRMTFFTPRAPEVPNYRLSAIDDAFAADVLNHLMASDTLLAAIDNRPVIWNAYTNVGYNSYWQREARTS